VVRDPAESVEVVLPIRRERTGSLCFDDGRSEGRLNPALRAAGRRMGRAGPDRPERICAEISGTWVSWRLFCSRDKPKHETCVSARKFNT